MISKMLPIDSHTTNCLFAYECFLYPAPFFNFIKSVGIDVYISRKNVALKRERDIYNVTALDCSATVFILIYRFQLT